MSDSFCSISPAGGSMQVEQEARGQKADQRRQPDRPGQEAQQERQGDRGDVSQGDGDIHGCLIRDAGEGSSTSLPHRADTSARPIL